MRDIQIYEVSKKQDLKDFIYFPGKLHRKHLNWVPPIYREEWNYFDPKKNHALAYCSTITAIAKLNGKTVGRIMGIINHPYNNTRNQKIARFTFFDCINSTEVSNGLLSFIETWAIKKGMQKIVGPMGMYYHDPMGFMTEGFDEKPSFSANYNFEYILSLLQSANYTTDTDLVVYKFKIPEVFPELHLRIKQRALRNKKLHLPHIAGKRDIRKYIFPLLSMMNETYQGILGYSQLNKDEMLSLANHFIPILDPKLFTVATYAGEVVGFIIGIPSLNEGIIAAKGRLYPFGFLKIIKASARSTQLDLLIGAVSKKFQGRGIEVLMGLKIMKAARESGMIYLDSHLELESNVKVRAEMERMGGKIIKRYSIYQKKLHQTDHN